jgi:hypothetical protein
VITALFVITFAPMAARPAETAANNGRSPVANACRKAVIAVRARLVAPLRLSCRPFSALHFRSATSTALFSNAYLSALYAAQLNHSATLFRRRYYDNGSQGGFILYMTDPALNRDDDRRRIAYVACTIRRGEVGHDT